MLIRFFYQNVNTNIGKTWFSITFVTVWLTMLYCAPITLAEMADYVFFSLLGMLGAIFANTTGAGGGVVFIPIFNQLAFTESQAVATSFAIQCFGMTAGAVTWWRHYRAEKTVLRLWQGYKKIIAVTSFFASVGVLLVYYYQLMPPASLHYSFSWFSLVLGGFILATVFLLKPQRESSQLIVFDYLAFLLIGFVGGVFTAWLSVGVGELLAIYLILRRFDINMAVAAAVVVSAVTVWVAIYQHILVDFQVVWQVVLFAGPSAVLGGIFAKTIVTHLSARRLKLFFAFWLVIIGIVGLKV